MVRYSKLCAILGALLRRVDHFCLGIVVTLLLLSGTISIAQERADSSAAIQAEEDIRALKPGEPLERELAGGEVHFYEVALDSGQYLHVVVEQKGVDVVVRLFGPDDEQLTEVDSPTGAQGPEPVSVVAETSGTYRLEVSPLEKGPSRGRYGIKIEDLRAATEQDMNRVAAERTFTEGEQLRTQGTAESLHKAIQKYEEALSLWRALGDSSREATTLDFMGITYGWLGQSESALSYYTQALSLFRAMGDSEGEGGTLNNIGQAYRALGKKRKALEYSKRALPLLRAVGDRYGEAVTLHTIGTIYNNLYESKKAIEYYNQALRVQGVEGDRVGQAFTLNAIGLVYRTIDEPQKAVEHFSQALPHWRAVDDRRGEGMTLHNMGLVYYSLGEKQKALESYAKALELRRVMGHPSDEATTLNGIGQVYYSLGEPQKALEHYNQALPLHRSAASRGGEANTLNNIGTVYHNLGMLQEAFRCFNQALPLRRAVGDRRGEAYALNNIGVLYSNLGENEKALDRHTQALEIRQAISHRTGEAQSRNNIGAVYKSMGNNQKALEYYTQALELMRASEDRFGEGNSLHNIGAVHYEMGDKQMALDFYERALSLLRYVGDRRAQAHTLNNLGATYFSLNDKQKALNYYTQALELRRAVGDRKGEAITLYNIARLDRDSDNLVEARTQIEAVLDTVEYLRTNVISPQLRASYFASVRKYHEFYIDLLMELHHRQPSAGYQAAALGASEHARARSLLEILTEAGADIRQGVNPELLERERTLQQQLNAKEQYRIKLLSGKHTEEQAVAVEKEVSNLLTEYEEIQAQIRITSPRYADLTQPQPLSMKEIQQQVLDEETILLEYSFGEERSFLWAVTPMSITSFELPKRAEIDSVVRQLYDLLKTRKTGQKYQKFAAALSQMLLGPVAAQLGTKRLLIVSEGALQYIPFGALPVPTTEAKSKPERRPPLIVEHEIVSLPSASVLAVLRRELAAREPAPKMVAVLANPVFSSEDPRVKQSRNRTAKKAEKDTTDTGKVNLIADRFNRSLRETGISDGSAGLVRLIFTGSEAENIMSFVPEGEGLLAVNFDASRATAMSPELSQFRIVHYATHALLNSQHPELSGIVLSLVDENGQEQDGFLRLHDIYNLNLPAELIVLSACQTALGKEIKGEGLVGLTRGFMYAGAKRVVASLWKVEDEATAELMKHFYQGILQKGLRPAEALRAGQVKMWKEGRWKSPYFWAAFVLQGEWR